jgi:hypothetical protein
MVTRKGWERKKETLARSVNISGINMASFSENYLAEALTYSKNKALLS